jgi:hypothetical protein
MPDSWVAVVLVPSIDERTGSEHLHVAGFSNQEDLERWLEVSGCTAFRVDAAQRVALASSDIILVPAIFAPRDRRNR